MNRLVFEDDDVIQQVLQMDSDTNNDSSTIDARPTSSKDNIEKSKVKEIQNQNILKTNDEKLINKEIEKKQDTENKYKCPKCSQEFEKKELQNHDCNMKKRKPLVLSFYKNQSFTSSLNAKNIRKSNIENNISKSDKRKSDDSSNSERIGKDNHKKPSKFGKNTNDLDEKDQNFEIKTSKTPIFYECPVCFQHFIKKEFDIHNCKDNSLCRGNSPCLTLTFLTSLNDSIRDRNRSKTPKKSVSFEEFPKKYIKSVNHKEKPKIDHRKDNSMCLSTELKEPITSQHFENEKILKKQVISLKNENNNAIKSKKSIKRKHPDIEKQVDLKPKNKKIDKQNNEKTQSIDTTLKEMEGDVNKTIINNKTSKHDQVGISPNKKPINKIKISKYYCIENNIDTELQQNVSTKRKLKLAKQNVTKSDFDKRKTVENSSELLKQNKISSQSINKMSKSDKKASKNANKNIQDNEIQNLLEKEKGGTQKEGDLVPFRKKQDDGIKNVYSNKKNRKTKIINSQTYKMFRLDELKIRLEKEDTSNKNLENKTAEVVTTRNEENVSTENEKEAKQIAIKTVSKKRRKIIIKSGKLLKHSKMTSQKSDKMSRIDKKSSKNVNKNVSSENYKLFRLNELKVLLEKEKDDRNLKNKKDELVTTRNEHNRSTENGNSNNQEKEGNKNSKNVEADLSHNEKNNGNEQSVEIESNQNENTEREIVKKKKRPNHQKRYKCRICLAKYTKIKHRKHICKNKVKKRKSKKKKDQIVKKSDALLENLKNDSQSKMNITILSRENVKVITVSNNAKDYEVNQGDLSNYVHSDQMSKQNEIKETTEPILTNIISSNKSSTAAAVSRNELTNISNDKSFENEKVAFLDLPGKTKPITNHKHSERRNLNLIVEELNKNIAEKSLAKDKFIKSDTISKKLLSKENSKIQENNIKLLQESQKQNTNEKDNEKQETNNLQNNSNSTKIESTISSQNSDHSYSATADVENNLSMNTVGSDRTVPTQNVEHNYSVTEKSIKTTDTILTENKRIDEISTNKNEENETVTNENKITSTKDKEKERMPTVHQITSTENKEIEIMSTHNKITTSKNEISITKHKENKFLKSNKLENIFKNNLKTHKNRSGEENIPLIFRERIRSIEIIDIFSCIHCSHEFSENDIKKHVCPKNTNINQLGKVPQIEKPNHNVEKNVIAVMDEVECYVTVPDIVGNEIILPEKEITISENRITLPENVENEVTVLKNMRSEITDSESQITIKECEITLPKNVESEVTINESVETEITASESEITIPEIVESEVTVTTENENTTPMPDIENFTIENIDQEIIVSNENVANEVIITTLNEGLDNIELPLKDNSVAINNVAQGIIIPAAEEIIHDKSEIVSANVEYPVAIATQIESDRLVSIENVEQEFIIITENIEVDDVSIEKVGDKIVIQNVENNVSTIQIKENDNIVSTEFKENKNRACNESLINNEQHNVTIENRENNIKISTENIEHQMEKVSVEILENQVFVPKYVANDSIIDSQIETNVKMKNIEESDSIKNVQTNETNIAQQDEASISTQKKTNVTNNVEASVSVENEQAEANVSSKHIGPSDSINATNKSTQNDKVSVKNIGNTNIDLPDQNHPTVNINNGKDDFVQNELTTLIEKCVLVSQSEQSKKISPTNDEIETIIIISSENENKKNIVLTQNEKNETVIIITKQKEKISADNNSIPSRVEEITVQNHHIEHLVGNQHNKLSLTEKDDVETINKRKCSKCLKIFIEDKFISHKCIEDSRDKNKESEITKSKTVKTLLKKYQNCDENKRVKAKEDNTLSIETQLAAIVSHDSQNDLSETQEHSMNATETHKNNENKDITVETQLAAILIESQNKMADKQEHSTVSSSNYLKKDHTCIENNENKETSLTNNQLLDILSKNVEDTSQVDIINQDTVKKENIAKTKCFRCLKKFTDRELTSHNCLEYVEKATPNSEIEKTPANLEINTKKLRETAQNSDKIEKDTRKLTEVKQHDNRPENNVLYAIEIKENLRSDEKTCTDQKTTKTKSIRCFTCSEIYDKTHICSNTKKQTDNNNTSVEKPNTDRQNESKPNDNKKKSKYCFDAYILVTKDGMYECKICSRQYTARKNLVRHIHQHEKGYDRERFKCSLCPKTFQYKNSLKSHEACHAGQTYDCNICEQSFSRKTNLYTHIKLHSDEKFPCDKCGKEYTSKKCLLNHPCKKKKYVNPIMYSCNICSKKYKQKSNLIDHLHVHIGVKPYKCEHCNEKFQLRNQYNTHIDICTAPKIRTKKNGQLTCKICSKTLRNKLQLQKHEWRHENKYFVCNICQKQFKVKHDLKLHMPIHKELGLKRVKFECPECEKIFSTKFGLNLHLNKHTGVKFSCPLCEKLFTTKLLLRCHERTHTGQTPYACKNCKKAFNNRSNFNRHVKNKVCFFVPLEIETL